MALSNVAFTIPRLLGAPFAMVPSALDAFNDNSQQQRCGSQFGVVSIQGTSDGDGPFEKPQRQLPDASEPAYIRPRRPSPEGPQRQRLCEKWVFVPEGRPRISQDFSPAIGIARERLSSRSTGDLPSA